MAKRKTEDRTDYVTDRGIPGFKAAMSRFSAESETVAVLVGVAMIDRQLGLLLKSNIEKLSDYSESEIKDLLSPTQNAPLGSIYERSKIARAFGLIDKNTFEVIETLRKVRNEHAHYEDGEELTIEKLQGLYALIDGCEGQRAKAMTQWPKSADESMVRRFVFSCLIGDLWVKLRGPEA